jgi:hypothetical protein
MARRRSLGRYFPEGLKGFSVQYCGNSAYRFLDLPEQDRAEPTAVLVLKRILRGHENAVV